MVFCSGLSSNLKLPPNQSSLDPYLSHSKCLEVHTNSITKNIVDIAVCNLSSATLVEGAGFKVPMSYIKLNCHVSIATHIAEVVREKFINKRWHKIIF